MGGITGGVEDGVDNSGVSKDKLYSTPQDVELVWNTLSPISEKFTIAAAFGNVHQRQVLQNPTLADPIRHQKGYGERCRDGCSFEVFTLSRGVLGGVSDGDVEACKSSQAAEDEECKEEVVGWGSKSKSKPSGIRNMASQRFPCEEGEPRQYRSEEKMDTTPQKPFNSVIKSAKCMALIKLKCPVSSDKSFFCLSTAAVESFTTPFETVLLVLFDILTDSMNI